MRQSQSISLALELDPLIAALSFVRANTALVAGEYDTANSTFRTAAALGLDGPSEYFVGVSYALRGQWDAAAATMLTSNQTGFGEDDHVRQTLFLDALRDQNNTERYEEYARESFLIESNVPDYQERILQELALLNSPLFVELADDVTLRCRKSFWLIWHKRAAPLRSTREFFEWQRSRNAVDYWQTFGWPDDCASLDQSLANCSRQ